MECFESLARVLADYYSCLPPLVPAAAAAPEPRAGPEGEAELVARDREVLRARSERGSLHWIVKCVSRARAGAPHEHCTCVRDRCANGAGGRCRNCLYPAMRAHLLPPRSFADPATLAQVCVCKTGRARRCEQLRTRNLPCRLRRRSACIVCLSGADRNAKCVSL